METPDLVELVTAARDGDREAWGALVDQFAGIVFAVCRSFRLIPADAADVSQTVWLRLAENIERIEHPERLGSWLVTTTKRECLAQLRTRARFEPASTALEWVPSPHPEPEEVATTQETICEVATAFALLSARCRDLLRRVVTERMASYQSISHELGIPVGSIGPTRSRCLEHLRRHLQEARHAR